MILRKVLSLPQKIYFRDKESLEVFNKIVKKRNACLLPDIGILNYSKLKKVNIEVDKTPSMTIGINIVNFMEYESINNGCKKNNIEKINYLLKEIYKKHRIIFFSFYSDEQKIYDHGILKYFDKEFLIK